MSISFLLKTIIVALKNLNYLEYAETRIIKSVSQLIDFLEGFQGTFHMSNKSTSEKDASLIFF